MTIEDRLKRHHALVEQASRLLAGHDPEVQASVLAELLATWLSGWTEDMREPLLENHLQGVRELVRHVAVNTPSRH